jgi:hypothetical protein
MITHNTRCALCSQYVAHSDREAMLEAQQWEWDEARVDEARLDAHQCADTDPYGARQWARLEDAGMLRWTLAELISLELDRRRVASRPAWAVLAGQVAPTATTTTISASAAVSHTTACSTRVHGGRAAPVRRMAARGP